MFGEDFFKIFEFAIAIVRLFAKIFGDKDDQEKADSFGTNGNNGSETIVKAMGNKK